MPDWSPGSRLGPYEIEALLGRGGMGVVYRARDPRLGRSVAIKVLPEEVADDPERLARFEREARATAALDHPNLLAVYDVGVERSAPYLVCELLEGETLRERLRRGPLEWRRAVAVTREIAAGLAAAHGRGVVHRDLKPENVFLLADGRVKILDFGLATLGPRQQLAEGGFTSGETLEQLTREGVVLGTVGYMAPEQVAGRPADARADIFALGVVLFEMLSGDAPFRRETAIDSLHAILRDEPPALEAAGTDLPERLGRVVRHCLEKRPSERYQSVTDLIFDLDLVESSAALGATPRLASSGLGRWRSAAALAAVVILATIAALIYRSRSQPDQRGEARPGPLAVAVLPFAAAELPPKHAHLTVGLADEITTALTYVKGIAVRPFSRSSRYSSEDADIDAVGRALGADRLVLGRVASEGDQLRVSVEAIDVESDEIVWRDSWGAAGDDLLALRETMRQRVERSLVPVLGSETMLAERSHPRSAEAYDLYLRAAATSLDPVANRDAIELLERSVERDGGFAPAWLALAWRYHFEALLAEGADPAASERAYNSAAWALELDPDLFDAVVFKVQRDAETGNHEEAFRRAVELVRERPESGQSHALLGYVLRYGGALRESATECAIGMRLDFAAAIRCHWTFTHLGRYEQALELVDAITQADQLRASLRADNLTRMGDRKGALAEIAEIGDELAAIDIQRGCLRESPPEDLARRVEAQLEAYLLWPDSEALYWYAAVLSDCGSTEASLRFLAAAVDRGYCAAAVALDNDPLWEPLRGDPRLEAIHGRARACRERFLEERGGGGVAP